MRDAHLAENIFQTRSSNNFKRRQEIRLISYIKGTVAYKGKDSVVIENHGIGYQIKVPSRVLEGVNSGEEAMLHTYLYVREDQLALFGFSSIQELETFQILLGISGIGPKAALSVLSTMSVEDLYYAVFSEDAKSIAKTPGIGPKGAKRMIIAERQAESRRFRVSFRGRGSSATEFLYRRRQHCGYCTGISSIRLFEWRSISCRT